MPSAKFLALFTPANYRFSTHAGGRLTSLYYEDAMGNQGRWRRQHRDGEVLFFQGKSSRLFIHPDKLDGFEPAKAYGIWHKMADLPAAQPTKLSDSPKDFLRAKQHRQLVGASLDGIDDDEMAGAYSRSPQDGWHVIEINGTSRKVGHCSGGGILLQDPTKPGHAGHAALADYDGATFDWTTLGQ